MKNLLKNAIPLHKHYGFLLLNTSLIVFTPVMLGLLETRRFSHLSIALILSFALSLFGIILSILFILRKKIAIQLLTILLTLTIVILLAYLLFIFFDNSSHLNMTSAIFMINAFGFFIVEGILGLLIIHSNKLADEFQTYD